MKTYIGLLWKICIEFHFEAYFTVRVHLGADEQRQNRKKNAMHAFQMGALKTENTQKRRRKINLKWKWNAWRWRGSFSTLLVHIFNSHCFHARATLFLVLRECERVWVFTVFTTKSTSICTNKIRFQQFSKCR